MTVPPDDRLVGDCGLLVGEDGVAEIGFTLGREGQGQGFGAEAVRAVIRFAFLDLGVERIQAIVDARNGRAIRLLERVGLRSEEPASREAWFKGGWCVEHLFAVAREEWMDTSV